MKSSFIPQVIQDLPGHTLLSECQSYKPELGFTCNALDIGLDSYVRCLEQGSECLFAVPYADSRFCKCPARVYFVKELEKQPPVIPTPTSCPGIAVSETHNARPVVRLSVTLTGCDRTTLPFGSFQPGSVLIWRTLSVFANDVINNVLSITCTAISTSYMSYEHIDNSQIVRNLSYVVEIIIENT